MTEAEGIGMTSKESLTDALRRLVDEAERILEELVVVL